MTIINTNSISGINSITAQGASGVAFYDSSGSSERLRITSAGNVGINETNPGGLLQVGSSSASHVIITANTGIDINDGAINLYQATSNVNATPFIISTDVGGTETEKLRVTAGGVVGINKTSPSSEAGLDVVGSSYWPILVKTTSTGGGGVAIKNTDDITSLYTGSGGSSWLTGSATTDGLIRAQNDLIFASNANNERLRINSAGKLILPTGSPGIQFGSSDTGTNITSQTLDDYEEGYWFPYISGSTSGSVTSFNERMGTYTKIGNRVIAEFYLSNPGSNSGVSGNWRIDGLPYISSAIPNQGFGTNFYGGGAVHWARSVPTTSYLALSVPQSGGNYSWLIDGKTGNTESGLISGSIASNLLIRGSISYIHN